MIALLGSLKPAPEPPPVSAYNLDYLVIAGGGAGGSLMPIEVSGAQNTGGGGGGGVYGQEWGGKAGGSGIVKVRYTGTPRAAGGTITQSGGFTYHEFTSSGTLTFTS
jgi:hypothetical protein